MKNSNRILEKIVLTSLLFLVLNFIPQPGLANSAELYLFYDETCPVCTQAQKFLGQLKRKYPQLEIKRFSVFNNNDDNSKILTLYFALKRAYQMDSELSVPVIFIGEKAFNGYNFSIATEIEQTVIKCLSQQCPSPIEKIKKQNTLEKEKKGKSALSYFLIGGILLILFLLIKKWFDILLK